MNNGDILLLFECRIERGLPCNHCIIRDHIIVIVILHEEKRLTASHASSTLLIGTYLVSCGSRSWSRTDKEAFPSSSVLKMSERRRLSSFVAAAAMAIVVRAIAKRFAFMLKNENPWSQTDAKASSKHSNFFNLRVK